VLKWYWIAVGLILAPWCKKVKWRYWSVTHKYLMRKRTKQFAESMLTQNIEYRDIQLPTPIYIRKAKCKSRGLFISYRNGIPWLSTVLSLGIMLTAIVFWMTPKRWWWFLFGDIYGLFYDWIWTLSSVILCLLINFRLIDAFALLLLLSA
jgi:hypothetical protein